MFTSVRPKRSNYRLLGLVGQGQFGRVFCAIHRKTGELVALKDLNRDRLSTHKFLRELRFLLSLEHPNIVTCQALEHTATGRQLVLDYCEGGMLRHLIEQDIPLPLTESLAIVADVLAGLDHAHSQEIVHCDIKPENILLTLKSNRWVAKLSDFGIARLSQELNNAQTGDTGSPAYMAPERFYNRYSINSDIYSVGVILFELLTGHRPFSGTPLELKRAHLNQPVSIPETVPEQLREIIQTALQKLPARRFQSAAEMLAALKAVQQHLTASSAQSVFLSPAIAPSLAAFHAQSCEKLSMPLQALAATPKAWLYQGSGAQLKLSVYPNGLLNAENTPIDSPPLSLPHPIQGFQIIPQGCCVITHRSIHLLPFDQPPTQQVQPIAIAQFATDSLSTVAPNGQWFASISQNPTGQPGWLKIGRLLTINHPNRPDPYLRQTEISHQSASLLQLLPIDNRHLVLISTQAVSCKETIFEIFTRRGHYLGRLKLSVPLRQIVTTPTPYRLLAMEQDNASTILIVDLKPFRVFRLKLDIAPTLMTATDWGYLFSDMQGKISLFDRDANTIGDIDGPSFPTAMIPCQQHGLLIATWAENQGQLYRVDLRQLDIDILF